MHRRLSLVMVLLATGLAGCASFNPPQPWEKGELARPDMQFDANPLAGEVDAARLPEQGRRGRWLRRRRRRVWLQLRTRATV